MKHYIAMGGEHGCLPDNCTVYRSHEDAVKGLGEIYELSEDQVTDLTRDGNVALTRDQGGAYCEVSDCDCSTPWEHDEYGCEEDWQDEDDGEDDDEPVFLKMNGMDHACLGVGYQQVKMVGFVYSQTKILEGLVASGMTEEEAVDYFDYNIQGAWVGEGTPIVVDDTADIDELLNGSS